MTPFVLALALTSQVRADESSPAPAPGLPQGATETLRELPHFQPGLWHYRRTVELGPHAADPPDEVTRCSDPLNDIRRKMAEMQRKGCRIVGMTHIGSRFRSTWSCLVEDESLSVANVITAETTTAYQDMNESRYRDQSTRTVVAAARVGDCPAPAQ